MVRAPSTRAWLVAAVLLLAATLSLGFAHASRSRADDSRAVRRTVRTYEVALMAGDGRAACAQLTARARRDLLAAAAQSDLGQSCGQVATAMHRYVESLLAHAPTTARAADARRMIANPAVRVESIDGDRATARVEGTDRYAIPLVRSGGGWKIARLPSPATETQ